METTIPSKGTVEYQFCESPKIYLSPHQQPSTTAVVLLSSSKYGKELQVYL